MQHYNYIISGAGASGLSLLARMIQSNRFIGKKILVIDKDDKSRNDHTWCFWEKNPGFFEPIVYRRYNELWFHAPGYSALNDINPYQYKLIRGIDFYHYCFDLIKSQPNIQVLKGQVDSVHSDEAETYAIVEKEKYTADYIFNSILFKKPVMQDNQYYLLQHFRGWFIRASQPAFKEKEATLMDFRLPQDKGTTFVYMMPFSSTEALIEYTVFSESVFDPEQYREGLRNYINSVLGIREYEVIDEEAGAIPMTNYPFTKFERNVVNIGTAGGQTKASSGYTFQFIQKQSDRVLDAMINTGKPFYSEPVSDKRFELYDATLLNVLYNRKIAGASIFTDLFRKNDMRTVLKFLDNETSVMEEMGLVSVLPKKHFIVAAMEELFK
jgi:lycopene beta-cyclase